MSCYYFSWSKSAKKVPPIYPGVSNKNLVWTDTAMAQYYPKEMGKFILEDLLKLIIISLLLLVILHCITSFMIL